MTPEMTELIGVAVGAVLTLLVLSYLLFGDNPLYRLALHVLVGSSVGYVAAVAIVTVLIPQVLSLAEANAVQLVLPVVLGFVLLFKASPRASTLGNFSTAYLIGVGAAVGVAGALLGTILPQATASGSLFDWQQPGGPGLGNGLLIAVGTALALMAMTFTIGKRRGTRSIVGSLSDVASRFGRIFLVAAFGAAFAGALVASLTILIGRIYALIEGIRQLLFLVGG